MARAAEGLEVGPIPKAPEVPVVLDDMVHVEREGDIPAEGTTVRLLTQHTGT
jgi:hypothetical protein